MSLVEKFVEGARALVGKNMTGDELLKETFRLVTVSPLEGSAPIGTGHKLSIGDIAVLDGSSAVYVGKGEWVQSGRPAHISPTVTLNRGHALFVRPKFPIEVPTLGDDLLYWGLAYGTGQDINKVKAFCKDNGIPFGFKRTSRKGAAFIKDAISDAASKLPE